VSEHTHNPYSRSAPQPWPAPPPSQTTNGLAVASLVLGLVGWTLAGVGSVLAVIFGHIAIKQIDRSGGTQHGRGMALAGVVMGWIAIAVAVIAIIAIAADGSSY
jgi:hypothetical protein